MKKLSLFVLSGLIALGIVQGTGFAQTVNLTFSMWGGQDFVELYEELVDEYQETHPNVNVEIISIPYNDYHEKLIIMKAGNAQPDLGWVVEAHVPQFIELGMMEDVSAIQNDPSYDFEDIIPSTLELFRQDGKLYGVPFSTPPFMIFYNKSLFEENGLKTPTELYKEGNWNLKTMKESAEALTDPSRGIYGVRLFREWDTWNAPLTTLFRAYGGDVFDDRGRLIVNSPENVRALTYLYDLIFKSEAHPKPGDQLTFASGQVAMFLDGFSQVSNARKITDFEWDVAPIPAGPAGYHPIVGVAGYAVFDGSEHKETTLEFFKFLTSRKGFTKTAAYFVPPRRSILQSEEYLDDGLKPSPESRRMVILEQLPNAQIMDSHPQQSQIGRVVRIGLDKLYTGSLSPSEALEYIEESISDIIQ